MKTLAVFLLFMGISLSLYGQTCDCPAVGTCGACQGGITTFTLRYVGSTAQTITAADQQGTVFNAIVNPNTTFTFGGSLPNDKFVGPTVTMTVGGAFNINIPSNCGTVFTGNAYGLFTIAAANSKNGGLLCCSAANMETTPPVISNCPANMTVNLPATACEVAGGWTAPTAVDNCTLASFTTNIEPIDVLTLGPHNVTYTAVDIYGNTSSCNFRVTVVDNIKPVIANCPANITIEATSSCQAAVTWVEPTATDNCSATLTRSHAPGNSFPLGTTAVTYTATDPSGNITTCTFNVVVKDTTLPTIANCPADITTEATEQCQAVVTWNAPTASDNCSVTLTSTHSPGATFPLGTTAVTYTATDPSGNIKTCTFNVVVTNNTPPVFTGCPSDISMTIDACKTNVSWTPPVATSHCNLTVAASHEPGSSFGLGTTVVTYAASDDSGHTGTCTFNVIIKTNSAPTVTNCPDDITIHTYDDDIVVDWIAPQAKAFCGNLLVNASNQPGERFTPGTKTVLYEFNDGTNNKITCSFDVTVIKDEIEFSIGKAVTPNGDGVNETWELKDIEKFNNNSVNVVDRWGNKIYQGNGYDNTNVFWNATGPNGNKVPIGTYFYTIEVRVNDVKVRKSGFIEVVY